MHRTALDDDASSHRTEPPERLAYSVKDAALAIGISPRRMWTHIANNKIESFRDGIRRLISRRALEAFIAERESENAA